MTDVMPEQAVDLDKVLDNDPVAPVDEALDAVDEQLIARLAGKAREGGLQRRTPVEQPTSVTPES